MITLIQYEVKVKRCLKKIECPVCKKVLLVKNWTKHECSGTQRYSCPWCFGKVAFKHGDKEKHLPHLHKCFLNFKKIHAVKKVKTATTTKPLVPKSCCEECSEFYSRPHPKREMLGRERLRTVDVRFYESFFETVPEWLDLPESVDDPELRLVLSNGNSLDEGMSGLRGAVDWVKRFFAYGAKHRWYHVMVRAGAFASFLDALSEHSEDVCLLPYWCLCDGRSSPRVSDPLYVHHRHAILVTRLSGRKFENAVWRRVCRDESERGNFSNLDDAFESEPGPAFESEPAAGRKWDRFKLKSRIHDMKHFCNALCYVSLPRSRCKGVVGGEFDESADHRHHYHINNPVGVHAPHVLCRFYPFGQRDFVTRSVGPRISGLHSVAERRRENKNKHCIGPMDACPKVSRCPIPISKNFQLMPPTEDIPLDKALVMSELPAHYLFGDDKLMPVEAIEDLSDLGAPEWVLYQVEVGNNSFMERVRDDWVALGRRQQTFLNELEKITGELKSGFERQLEAKEAQLQEERKLLADKDRQLDVKDRQLQEERKLFAEKDRQLEAKDRQLEVKDWQLGELHRKYEEVLILRDKDK